MAVEQPENHMKLNFGHIVVKARSLWDSSPRPVKSFPWNNSSKHFVQLILDLVFEVINYLCIHVFADPSFSEMSYCAHERKLNLIPLPFLIGAVVAGVLKNAAFESSSYLKVIFSPRVFVK
ncbi:hypothetical protein ACS0TY_020099 [Phlomoides rotata]